MCSPLNFHKTPQMILCGIALEKSVYIRPQIRYNNSILLYWFSGGIFMIITITLNPAIDRTLRIEQPLQVNTLNRASSTSVEPGGKGINVSRAVKALGGKSVALGFSAGSNGRAMKDALTSMDIHHDFVDVPGNTRVNFLIIDQDGNHTEINEPGFKILDSDFLRFLERVDQYLDDENIFVISGSVPPFSQWQTLQRL